MADEKEPKEQVWFLGANVHKQHLKTAKNDRDVVVHHIHENSGNSIADEALFRDLCEYYILLHSYIKLMNEIALLPKVPGQDGEEDFVVGPAEALLLKFYIPMITDFESKIRRQGVCLYFH
jgi:hypothetical protein